MIRGVTIRTGTGTRTAGCWTRKGTTRGPLSLYAGNTNLALLVIDAQFLGLGEERLHVPVGVPDNDLPQPPEVEGNRTVEFTEKHTTRARAGLSNRAGGRRRQLVRHKRQFEGFGPARKGGVGPAVWGEVGSTPSTVRGGVLVQLCRHSEDQQSPRFGEVIVHRGRWLNRGIWEGTRRLTPSLERNQPKPIGRRLGESSERNLSQ